MSKFEDKITNWSEHEFGIKVNAKQSLNFLRTKNGPTFQKLFTFMTEKIKSKKNGEKMKQLCESIKCKNELQVINNEIQEMESTITSIRRQLIEEDMKRKTISLNEDLRSNRLYNLSIVVNLIQKISLKNKHSIHLALNSIPIEETILCYDKLFSPFDEFDSHNNSFSETSDVGRNANCSQLVTQINEMIENIRFILYDISQLEVDKQIDINFNIEVLSKCLMQDNEVIVIHTKHDMKDDLKRKKMESKVLALNELMKEYENIRESKMAKNKDKLQKVIHSCDEFIQQRRLKC